MDKFKIRECSDLDYEGMVVDLIYEDRWFATLSCDEGVEKTIIKILDPKKEEAVWEIDYLALKKVLNDAFEILKDANKNF